MGRPVTTTPDPGVTTPPTDEQRETPPLRSYELTWMSGHVETIRASQVTWPNNNPFSPSQTAAMHDALPTLLATIRRLQAACDAKQAVIDAVTEL